LKFGAGEKHQRGGEKRERDASTPHEKKKGDQEKKSKGVATGAYVCASSQRGEKRGRYELPEGKECSFSGGGKPTLRVGKFVGSGEEENKILRPEECRGKSFSLDDASCRTEKKIRGKKKKIKRKGTASERFAAGKTEPREKKNSLSGP